MRRKSIARKPRKNWDIWGFSDLLINLTGLEMSTEPRSTIKTEDDLDDFRTLARIPMGITVNRAGGVRPEMCSKGYAVIYEYPFKIGFRWPYSPLAKAFMCEFDLSPGQLMPQFWRVIHVIERLDPSMGVKELLTAYKVKKDHYWRYSLFSRYKGERNLVLNTGVNDRGWKARYVFVRLSTLDTDSDWIREGWNMTDIDFDKVKSDAESKAKIERFLMFSAGERSYVTRHLVDEDDNIIFLSDRIRMGREKGNKEEGESKEKEDSDVEITGESSSASRRITRTEMIHKMEEGRKKDILGIRPEVLKKKEDSTTGSGLLKRRGVSMTGSDSSKKTRTSVLREPPLKTGIPSRNAPSQKTRASAVRGATGAKSDDAAQLATVFPVIVPGSSSAARGKDAQTGSMGETTVNFTLPSDFMDGNALDEAKLFPHLEKYQLSSFRERLDKLSFEEKESHVAGLFFLALQASLVLQADTRSVAPSLASVISDEDTTLSKEKEALERVNKISARLDDVLNELEVLGHTKDDIELCLKESLSLMHDQKKVLAGLKKSVSEAEKEIADSKSKLGGLEKELEGLEDDNKSFSSLARLTARAAIMRQHLQGKNPLASAATELDTFLREVGTERDLDLDDEKEFEEEAMTEGFLNEASGQDVTKDLS